MTKVIYALMVIVLLMGLSLGYAQPTSTPIVWIFLEDNPSRTHPLYLRLKSFAEEVNQRAEGRLILELRNTKEMGYKGEEHLRVLKAGAAQIDSFTMAHPSGDLLLLMAFDLPILFPDQASVVKAYKATEDIWRRELAKWDILPIGIAMVDEQIFYSKKPLRTLDDLKGQKFRAYNKPVADLLSALRASPVSIPFLEQYSALQRGVVDGSVTGGAVGLSLMFWEVTNHFMVGAGIAYAVHMTAVSKPHWDKLPKDLQKIVLDASSKVGPDLAVTMTKLGEDAYAKFIANGMKMTRISPEDRARIVKLADELVWKKWLEEAGPVGKEMLDKALKAIR